MRRIWFVTLALAAGLACTAQAPAPGHGARVNADWLRKPSWDDFALVWPKAAFKAGLKGSVMLTCEVSVEGLLDRCQVKTETPPGRGYGAAALLLAPQFRMRPATVDGAPVRSAVDIPLNFDPEGYNMADLPTRTVAMHPVWEMAPTRAEVRAAYPRNATGEGSAMLQCVFAAGGRLGDCDVIGEQPRGRGFGAAARSLAARFKGPSERSPGVSIAGLFVRVPFYFGPGGVTPDVNPNTLFSSLSWVSAADVAEVDALYPTAARTAGVQTGHVGLKCATRPDGRLGDCSVEREDPKGLGFAEAALKISGRFRANPWTADGRAVADAPILIPMRLDNPDAAQAAAPSPKP